jgi:hypothetical protein
VPTPLRWRLLDYDTRVTLTECTDIDGLFSDRVFPVEPTYEQYTLTGCQPAGPLGAAIDGTGPAWLGNLFLEGAHVPGRPVSEGCPPGCAGCYNNCAELLDVRVVGHRPHDNGSGLLDVDLEGHLRQDDVRLSRDDLPGYRLSAWPSGSPAGECRGVTGLRRARPERWSPGPPLTLLGCRPGLTGQVDAALAHVRVDGPAHTMGDAQRVWGDVVDTRPSALGAGLVDVALDARLDAPLAANDRPLWNLWRAGGPATRNEWAPLARSDRYLWVHAANVHRNHAPDRPAAPVYHLDGRHVTDYDGFFCAIGEALNGPGGWFGGDLFWLHENIFDHAGNLNLVWHSSDVARTHLVPGYDRKAWDAAVTFDDLVRFLTEERVNLDLR